VASAIAEPGKFQLHWRSFMINRDFGRDLLRWQRP
jgi:hypothetical protein